MAVRTTKSKIPNKVAVVSARLTAKEHEAVARAAAREGRRISDWARAALVRAASTTADRGT